MVAIAALFMLVPATSSLGAPSATRHVLVTDDCDPATFNAVLGPGSCVKDGDTTFDEFIGQLITLGTAPAWRFIPGQLRLAAGGTLIANNRGGEGHTYSEVANFGGGCIPELNDILGLTPVPECAGFPGGVFGATFVPAGSRLTTTGLAPGTHLFECLIHPWMRNVVNVK
ncbi:MAG TPA: hypothetical protein VGR41_10410 [Actinomycetota bacterium]|nr:hypothetical protein [Actinomycetota bacterium]